MCEDTEQLARICIRIYQRDSHWVAEKIWRIVSNPNLCPVYPFVTAVEESVSDGHSVHAVRLLQIQLPPRVTLSVCSTTIGGDFPIQSVLSIPVYKCCRLNGCSPCCYVHLNTFKRKPYLQLQLFITNMYSPAWLFKFMGFHDVSENVSQQHKLTNKRCNSV